MGLACGIPAWFVGGILFGTWAGKRIHVEVPEDRVVPEAEEAKGHEPGIGTVLLVIGLPMILILGGTFGNVFAPPGALRDTLIFFGNPGIALTVAVLIAMWLLGFRQGMSAQELGELSGSSLRPVGMILLVVGAGAFFGAVLAATGVGTAVATTLSGAGLPLIVSAYVIACGMRIAQGSATVAIVTTGGILAPSLTDGQYTQPQLALIVMAISAGSIIASHVNDGGFWIISKYFNMTVKETLQTWTVLETVLSVVGFGMAALLFSFV